MHPCWIKVFIYFKDDKTFEKQFIKQAQGENVLGEDSPQFGQ